MKSVAAERMIALYATETMADWEFAYLTTQVAQAEAIRPGRFDLTLAGDGLAEVASLGTMPIRPTVDVAELADDSSLAALVIPGGEHYDSGHDRLLDLIPHLLQRGVPVAAICGGTLLLARAGVLDDRRHTSNAPEFLQLSGYQGAGMYVSEPVVTDRRITTAGGVHPVAFTAEVMRLTQLCPDDLTAAWERLFSTGEADAFDQLMQATHAWQTA